MLSLVHTLQFLDWPTGEEVCRSFFAVFSSLFDFILLNYTFFIHMSLHYTKIFTGNAFLGAFPPPHTRYQSACTPEIQSLPLASYIDEWAAPSSSFLAKYRYNASLILIYFNKMIPFPFYSFYFSLFYPNNHRWSPHSGYSNGASMRKGSKHITIYIFLQINWMYLLYM